MHKTSMLDESDANRMYSLLAVFGEAFGEEDYYLGTPPSLAYVRELLSSTRFIALICEERDRLVGGLVAYELPRFESESLRIHVADLAVLKSHRQRGIATALLDELRVVARQRNASLMCAPSLAERG